MMTKNEVIEQLESLRIEADYMHESDEIFVRDREALDIAIKELKSRQWISVKDKMPPKWEDVIIAVGTGFNRHTGYGYYGSTWYECDDNGAMEEADITHWMPFPEPPKED